MMTNLLNLRRSGHPGTESSVSAAPAEVALQPAAAWMRKPARQLHARRRGAAGLDEVAEAKEGLQLAAEPLRAAEWLAA